MGRLQTVLEQLGVEEDELALAVEDALSSLPVGHAAELTEQDVDLLAAGGLEFGDAAREAGHRARKNLIAEHVALVAGFDTATVARALEVSESRVRHYASDGFLLAGRVGRGLRFPKFQFGLGTRPLPGLRLVFAAVPRTWPIAQVAAFMTTAQAELTVGRGHAETPRDWLVSGGDPAVVAALLGPDWA